MLRILRENTGNWIIKIFLAIIVIVFVFLGVGSLGSKKNNSVATIDKEPVTIQEYQRSYKMLVNQMESKFGKNLNEEILNALNVKQQALELLIEDKLLLKQADDLKIIVSDKELQENLKNVKAFQINGQFDFAQYMQILKYNGLTPEMFEQGQIDTLRRQKVRQIVTSAVAVSELEARDWYLYMNTKMAVDYLKFDPNSYSPAGINEESIKKYYDSNKDKFKSESKVRAAYLTFSINDYKDEVNVTDVQIKEYYEDNIEKYKTSEMVEARHILILVDENAESEAVEAARKRAQLVYERALNGEDFIKLARELSEGPSSTEGGYLGKFDQNQMIKPFSEKAFSMNPGEIGNPIRTKYGWHVIKVLARFDASTKGINQVSKQIKEKIAKEQMQLLAEDLAEEAFKAVDNQEPLEQVAIAVNKEVMETKPFTISGESLDIPYSEKFAQAAFLLNQGETSDVQFYNDTYYIIKVIERIDPKVQPIEKVKDMVEKQLLSKLKDDQALKDADDILAQAGDLETLSQLADKNNRKIKTTDLFKRDEIVENIGNVPGFVQASFSLSEDRKIHPKVLKSDSGYYIIGLNRIEQPSETNINDNLKSTAFNISLRKQAQAYNSWLEELKKQYNITYNPKLFN